MAKNLYIQAPVVDSYGNPVLNIEEDSSLSIDTSAVENYASPVLVVDDATADYVAYIEFGGSGDITNYYTKAEVDAIIARYATKEEVVNIKVNRAHEADASGHLLIVDSVSDNTFYKDAHIEAKANEDNNNVTLRLVSDWAGQQGKVLSEGATSIVDDSGESAFGYKDILSMKAEAYDFINLGSKNGLLAAIKAIPKDLRMLGQVVSFVNLSLKRDRVILIDLYHISKGTRINIRFGQVLSEGVFEAPSDDLMECKLAFYNFILNDRYIKEYLISNKCNFSTTTGNITISLQSHFTKDIAIGKISEDGQFGYQIKTIQEYNEEAVESYQYIGKNINETTFLNINNWVIYNYSDGLQWEDF